MARKSGFGSEERDDDSPTEYSEILSLVQPDDLVEFGMIPEFVGRLPCITSLSALDEEAMVRILTEPRNAIIRQYQKFFEIENTQLEFTVEAFREIAKKAMKRDVGARALRAVVEELMLDIMYDLPEQKEEHETYEITADMVTGKTVPTLFSAREQKKESA